MRRPLGSRQYSYTHCKKKKRPGHCFFFSVFVEEDPIIILYPAAMASTRAAANITAAGTRAAASKELLVLNATHGLASKKELVKSSDGRMARSSEKI